MDILFLETEASKLRINLIKSASPRNKLFQLYLFLDFVLKEDNHNAVESYLLEFAPQYCDLVSKVSFSGVHPDAISDLLTQIRKVYELYPESDKERINNSIDILQQKYDRILTVMKGEQDIVLDKGVYLPLLEEGNHAFDLDYGLLSSLSVQLKPLAGYNKFHVIPGSGDPEPEMKKQMNDSLINALRIAGKYTKLKHRFWDVYIDFENKSGEYSGISFGMLLVLKIVEELLRYFDSPTKIFNFSSSALTGSVDEKGNIPSLSGNIISRKTKTVFFSGTEVFVIPEDDLPAARATLIELNTAYPNRKLKLMGIRSIEDLFNLRNVVGMKKESGLLRTAKVVKKQAVSILLLITLTTVIFFSGLWDFDTNPDHFEYKGKVGFIKNKNGRVLFKTHLTLSNDDALLKGLLKQSGKIVDINGDGTNEIILSTSYQLIGDNKKAVMGISCYDDQLNEIWNYSFTKKVSTLLENHTDTYDIRIIDTLTVNDTLSLYCIAVNSPNEMGTIFRINLRDGRNIGNILWNSGHLEGAVIEDCDQDGQKELYVIGLNNGLGRSVFFSIDIDKIGGQLPALPEYRLLNIKDAYPNQYLLLPKSDYTNYFDNRYNVPNVGSPLYDSKKNEFLIYAIEGSEQSNWAAIGYRFNPQLRLLSVVFSDAIIKKRNTLIKEGKLKGPLTRTKEFEQNLISQLRYWDGKEFVTAEQRFNKK